ncbi:MAG: hypothetical protein J6K42_03885 [Clostridia bacterium]|nr:hypothetical protein [Clostridia bacterium]
MKEVISDNLFESNPRNLQQEKSTECMQEYIQDVLDIVISLYKEVAPELISQSLNIDMSKVATTSSKDIMKMLNNMKIDYKAVTKPEYERISYRDYIRDNIKADIMGTRAPQQPDVLLIHLYEPEVLNQSSTEDIKMMRDKIGLSKFISDINFVSHEMAHAFEHLVKSQNPSYLDLGISSMKKNMQGITDINYDPGESFAVSMERIILDKLEEDGKLAQYGLDKYVKKKDIEDVWTKKRIIHYAEDIGIVGKTSEGQTISYLDLDLEAYKIMKNQGMEKMLQYVKCLDFYKLNSAILKLGDSEEITKFCDEVNNKNYEEYLIKDIKSYEPIYSKEDIISMQKSIKKRQESMISKSQQGIKPKDETFICKRSIQDDYQEAVESATDISYSLEAINQAIQNIKFDLEKDTNKGIETENLEIE